MVSGWHPVAWGRGCLLIGNSDKPLPEGEEGGWKRKLPKPPPPKGLVGFLEPPGIAWNLPGLPGASWGLLGPPGISWGVLGPPGASWDFLGPPGTSRGLLGPPEAFWGFPGPSATSWASWAFLGSLGGRIGRRAPPERVRSGAVPHVAMRFGFP